MNVVALLTTKHQDGKPKREHGEREFWQERGAEYVRKLFSGIGRHMPKAFSPWLITDTPSALPFGVNFCDFPWELKVANARGWWAKLAIFRPGLFREKTLYLDLDNVIARDLTPLAELEPDPMYMLDDVVHPGLRNASTLLFTPGEFTNKLYMEYIANPRKVEAEFSKWPHASDQAFIAARFKERYGREAPTMQSRLPSGYILNSRAELEQGVDCQKTALVFGSWDPKPHDSTHSFYIEHWR